MLIIRVTNAAFDTTHKATWGLVQASSKTGRADVETGVILKGFQKARLGRYCVIADRYSQS